MTKKDTGLPRPTMRRVPLGDLQTDEETFQPRSGGTEANHVAKLCDVLRRGHELDPIRVWEDPESGALVVADGHHRLEAYNEAAKVEKVKVAVYRCDLETALEIPMVDNTKDRLSVSKAAKTQYAWRRVNDTKWTKPKIAKVTGTSERTVAYLRKLRIKLEDMGEDVPEELWQARAIRDGRSSRPEDADWDARREEAVDEADRKIGSTMTALFQRWPDAAVDFIERCAGRNDVPKLIERWADELVGNPDMLAFRMGEAMTPEEIEKVCAEAKRQAERGSIF